MKRPGGRLFVTTRAFQQLHLTDSALLCLCLLRWLHGFSDWFEQCLDTGTGRDGCIAWSLHKPGFRSFVCLLLLPHGGFPNRWEGLLARGVLSGLFMEQRWDCALRFSHFLYGSSEGWSALRCFLVILWYGMCVCVRVRLFPTGYI
ncbi:hypothetical protein M747DRAFT_81693 [Aspergillus niger ATCC 13496]|uniref:Uncharacterized protein n=1 Tax=Aspergillus niger ATCC 13496 TaxID=1353008 RepID=A0A370BRH6_ASPNG|nr:hypothetical protein M747DRAFT_81693 [Aspergillus niger ATCC 13496]